MIEKSEDEIVAECVRVLQHHELTRHITHVPIVAMGMSGTPGNWTYGVLDLKELGAVEVAWTLIMSVAARWTLKDYAAPTFLAFFYDAGHYVR